MLCPDIFVNIRAPVQASLELNLRLTMGLFSRFPVTLTKVMAKLFVLVGPDINILGNIPQRPPITHHHAYCEAV